MTIDPVLPAGPAGTAEPPRLLLVPPLEPSAAQQDFVAERDRVLPRAAVSGERSTTALYLILRTHRAEPGTNGAGLCCVTCRGRGPAERADYPCPTAEQALWALVATLR